MVTTFGFMIDEVPQAVRNDEDDDNEAGIKNMPNNYYAFSHCCRVRKNIK